MSNALRLLDRLEHVRKYGGGWRARCPAHDGRSVGSLSISESDDGKVLLWCWGGCNALEVLEAVGLTFSDLFPERITPDMTPQQQRMVQAEMRERAKLSRFKAAASEVAHEVAVVGAFARKIQVLGEDLHGQLADGDIKRFHQAQERLLRIAGDLNEI